MSVEERKALVRRLTKAVDDQDFATIDEIMVPELATAFKESSRWTNATFAGHKTTITNMVAEGDKVAAQLATQGGHSGEFEGVPPTGKEWINKGSLFATIVDGKIVEADTLFDELGHLKQLGATIAPPATA